MEKRVICFLRVYALGMIFRSRAAAVGVGLGICSSLHPRKGRVANGSHDEGKQRMSTPTPTPPSFLPPRKVQLILPSIREDGAFHGHPHTTYNMLASMDNSGVLRSPPDLPASLVRAVRLALSRGKMRMVAVDWPPGRGFV